MLQKIAFPGCIALKVLRFFDWSRHFIRTALFLIPTTAKAGLLFVSILVLYV